MSVTAGNHSRPQPRHHSTEPKLTEREAAALGFPKAEYAPARIHAVRIMEEHAELGTPRDQWEPQPIHGDHISSPYVAGAQDGLDARLEAEVDPRLDEIQARLNGLKADLDDLERKPRPMVTRESGTAHSAPEAVGLVAAHDEKIDADEAQGRHHHRRSAAFLRRVAPWLPWIEAVGFLFFVAYFLNVPFFRPWEDFGAWTLSVTIVAVTIAGQSALVHQAARNHNHGREAYAEGHREEAEWAFKRRNMFAALTLCTVTAAVTLGLVLRGADTLGDAGIGTIVFMVFVAIVAGVVMPALAFLAEALDGSRASRERDELVAGLDADLEAYDATIDGCQRSLDDVADSREAVYRDIFPDIVNGVQLTVDGAYRPYGLVRLLIGDLRADPPKNIHPRIERDATTGVLIGRIATSIDGAREVDLRPLFDRGKLLAQLEADREQLEQRLRGVKAHPWGRSRTD